MRMTFEGLSSATISIILCLHVSFLQFVLKFVYTVCIKLIYRNLQSKRKKTVMISVHDLRWNDELINI